MRKGHVKFKEMIRNVIYSRRLARIAIRPILKMHTLSGSLADIFAIAIEDVHPKHRILRYKEWFLEKIEKGWVVLDIGSNTGLMASLLSEKAGFVYGIEIKKGLISEANLKRKKENIEYIHADASSFEFEKLGAIDTVILSNVLEHMEDRVRFLKNLMEKVNWRDSGRRVFLFRVPMLNRDWMVLYKKELGMDYKSDVTHCTEYTLETFKDELAEANIKILESEIRFGEIYAVCQGG